MLPGLAGALGILLTLVPSAIGQAPEQRRVLPVRDSERPRPVNVPRGIPFPSIATDPASSASTSVAAATLSWSHTVGAGSNRLLMVGISISSGTTVSSIVYGLQALSLVGGQNGQATQTRMELWSLIAPSSGTATVTVTMSSAAILAAGATSFSDVDQTTPLGLFASAGGNTQPATVAVSSAVGELVIDTVAARGDAVTVAVDLSQSQLWNLTTGSSPNDVIGAGSIEPGAASVTMSWTLGVSPRSWALGAVSIRPIAPTPTPTFTSTATPTFTPSSTPTFTASNTPTFTASPTPTFTASPTPTFTASPTPTFTASPTATFTASPTQTFTASPTPTFTASPTPTFTASPTPTFTASPTPTFTASPTPTFTASPTPTFTSSPTPTFTASPTPTFTASPTPTFTSSPTPTFTASPTSTFTASPTPTFTASPTPTFTASATPTFTASPTPTATTTGSATATPTPTSTPGSPTPTPTPGGAGSTIPTLSPGMLALFAVMLAALGLAALRRFPL